MNQEAQELNYVNEQFQQKLNHGQVLFEKEVKPV
jgi:hypothetical protein